MADDVVKNELRAVRDLKNAVDRYAELIRSAAAYSRHEVMAADHTAQEAVAHRRSELQRAEQELQQARAALAQCRENCGGLRQAERVAQQRHAETSQRLDRARKAAHLTSSAQSDLLKVLQTMESVVSEQSSVASNALASLEGKLSQLPHFAFSAAIHDVLMGAGVAAEIAVSTMGISKLVGNISQGAIPTADRVTSVSEGQDLQTEDGQQLWKDVELDYRRRNYSDGGETDA